MRLTEYLDHVESGQTETLADIPVPEEAAEGFVARVRAEIQEVRTETGVSDFEVDTNLAGNIGGQYNLQTKKASINAQALLDDTQRSHILMHEGGHALADRKEDQALTDVTLIEGLNEGWTMRRSSEKNLGIYREEVQQVERFATETFGSVTRVLEMYEQGEHAELQAAWDGMSEPGFTR